MMMDRDYLLDDFFDIFLMKLIHLPNGGVFQGRLDTADGKAMWVAGPPKASLLAAKPGDQRRMLDALADSSGAVLPGDLAARLAPVRHAGLLEGVTKVIGRVAMLGCVCVPVAHKSQSVVPAQSAARSRRII